MEKQTYEAPEMEVVLTDDPDVILASGKVEEIPWAW